MWVQFTHYFPWKPQPRLQTKLHEHLTHNINMDYIYLIALANSTLIVLFSEMMEVF